MAFKVSKVIRLVGWHIVQRQITIKSVQRNALFHAINVELNSGQAYGCVWLKGFPIPNDWEPTVIPVRENFWDEQPIDRKTVVDSRVQVQFNLLKKKVQEGEVIAVLNDSNYISNFAVYSGSKWIFLTSFDRDANSNAQFEKSVREEIEQLLKAEKITEAQVANE